MHGSGVTCARDGFFGAEGAPLFSALSCLLRADANRAQGVDDDKGAGGVVIGWSVGAARLHRWVLRGAQLMRQ